MSIQRATELLESGGVTTHTFHDESVATGNGTMLRVGRGTVVTLSGIGTSASRTVEFRGIDFNGNDDLINGFDKDFNQATGFTANGKMWQVPVEGYTYFYCKITALAGGNETIKGTITC